MKKLNFAVFLSLILIFNSVVPCYTGLAATSSEQVNIDDEWIGDDGLPVASSSDAEFDVDNWVNQMMDYSKLSSGDGDFPFFYNTVDLSDVSVTLQYYDMSSVARSKVVHCDSSGHFNLTRPADYVKPIRLYITAGKSALPSAGKYKYQVQCGTNGGGSNNPVSYQVGFGKKSKNVEWIWEYSSNVTGMSVYSAFYMDGTVTLGTLDAMEWSVYYHDFGFGFMVMLK